MNIYSDKLKDPRWQRKRLEILDRDNFTCQCCQDTETELQVHHKSYAGNPWEAPNNQLVTFCKNCHATQFVIEDADIIKVIKCKSRTLICKLSTGDVAIVLLPLNNYEKPQLLILFKFNDSNYLNTIINLLNEEPHSSVPKPVESDILNEF